MAYTLEGVTGIYDDRYAVLRDRLREARLAAGLTQVEAGERLGRNQQHINRCEAGDRRIDVIELLDFAAIYGCAVSDLLPAADERTPAPPESAG